MPKNPKEPKSSDPKVVALRASRAAAKPWEHAPSQHKAQKPRPKQQLRRRP